MRAQVQAYRERYGSAFSAVGEALINAIMPLCPELVRWHFGLTDQAPPRHVHPKDSRWLEGLARGQLESTFSQMAQEHRFGAPPSELEALLMNRVRAEPPLSALIARMGKVQDKWIQARAPSFSSRLLLQPPDKLILNQFATEWVLAAAHELRLRADLCADEQRLNQTQRSRSYETMRMRAALSAWTKQVLNAEWCEALQMLGLIEQRWMELDLEAEQAASHQAADQDPPPPQRASAELNPRVDQERSAPCLLYTSPSPRD